MQLETVTSYDDILRPITLAGVSPAFLGVLLMSMDRLLFLMPILEIYSGSDRYLKQDKTVNSPPQQRQRVPSPSSQSRLRLKAAPSDLFHLVRMFHTSRRPERTIRRPCVTTSSLFLHDSPFVNHHCCRTRAWRMRRAAKRVIHFLFTMKVCRLS